MLKWLHENRRIQLVLGLLMGVCFGFLLQKGQVTKYDTIMGQLFLKDFTVLKVMLSAVVTGMIGIHVLKNLGLVQFKTKSGSAGSIVIGGLIFGVGFATLGYCPGTLVGAVGQGSLDALFGGILGMLLGTGIFAALYPFLKETILDKGDMGDFTLPQLLGNKTWVVIAALSSGIIVFFILLEIVGL